MSQAMDQGGNGRAVTRAGGGERQATGGPAPRSAPGRVLALAVGLLLCITLSWVLWQARGPAAGAVGSREEAALLPTPNLVTVDGDGGLVWHSRDLPVQTLRSGAVFALALLGIALVFVPLEALVGGPRVARGGRLTDAVYWFFTPMVTKPISKATVVLAPALAASALLPLSGPAEGLQAFWRRQPAWLMFVEMILICDLCSYWMHRLFHTRWLWRFHAIHHSSEEVDWLSSVRVHPVNDVLQRAAHVAPLLLLGFPIGAVGLLAAFLSLASLVLHSNLAWTLGPLRYVIASPTFHRWHHTSEAEAVDKNFAGLLSLCDLVFGTFYLPPDTAPKRFGLLGSPVPGHLLGQLAYPFVRRTPPASAG